MRKVLAGGTFNLLHPGHIHFLEKAKALGDYLVVVVANDKTVMREKGFLLMKAQDRKRILESLRMVDRAVIGDEKDFLKVVRKERPDIIALGYDQEPDGKMRRQIWNLGIKIARVRSRLRGYKTEKIAKSLKGKGHKTSPSHKSII